MMDFFLSKMWPIRRHVSLLFIDGNSTWTWKGEEDKRSEKALGVVL